MSPKRRGGQKKFITKIFLQGKIFVTKYIFITKIFLQGKTFVTKYIFITKIFLRGNIFVMIFLDSQREFEQLPLHILDSWGLLVIV